MAPHDQPVRRQRAPQRVKAWVGSCCLMIAGACKDGAGNPCPLICFLLTGPGPSLGALPASLSTLTIPTFSPVVTSAVNMLGAATTHIPAPPEGSKAGAVEGLALPAKLVRKILDLDYVDMHELLPDTWRYQEEDQKCCHQRRGQRRGPITDILLWTECYAALVSILSTKFPEKTPQFMAYLKTIVKAQRTFTGEGWVTYDACYRRKAALTKSLEWGAVDFTLYNETFTGRAKALTRCRYCLSEHHVSANCVYAPQESQNAGHPRHSTKGQNQLCQLFNTRGGNRCYFNPCRFQHLCSECQGNHPMSTCRRARSPPPKRPRVESPGYRAKK